jgi:transposase
MGDLSDFERGKFIGTRLPGASVTKTTTLLGVSTVTVSEVMSAFTNHGKTTSAKRNSGRKSTLTERDRCALIRIVLKNYRTIAELNIRLQDPVYTKSARRELHKFSIHGRAATAEYLICSDA